MGRWYSPTSIHWRNLPQLRDHQGGLKKPVEPLPPEPTPITARFRKRSPTESLSPISMEREAHLLQKVFLFPDTRPQTLSCSRIPNPVVSNTYPPNYPQILTTSQIRPLYNRVQEMVRCANMSQELTMYKLDSLGQISRAYDSAPEQGRHTILNGQEALRQERTTLNASIAHYPLINRKNIHDTRSTVSDILYQVLPQRIATVSQEDELHHSTAICSR